MATNNYYAPDFDPWVGNIRRIGSMLAQVPAMRAQAQERQQRMRLLQAQTQTEAAQQDNYEAGARKSNAQATDQEGQTESGNRLSAALKKVVTNPNDTDATGDAISEFGHYFKRNPEQAAKGMGDLLSHVMAIRGDTNFAEQGSLQGNAASIANNQANNNRVMNTPMVVPDNSVAIDKTTGTPVATSPQKLSMGQRLLLPGADNVTLNKEPAAEGAQPPPKSSAADAARARLGADLVKGGNTIDSSIAGTNAPAGLSIYDALMAQVKKPEPVAAGQGTAATVAPQIPDSAIAYLKSNPGLRASFDQKYGAGMAAKILGR